MTTDQMLSLLMFSKNEIVAGKALKIISGEMSIQEELKYCGSFMKAVLTGDYEQALRRADADNYFALTGQSTKESIQ